MEVSDIDNLPTGSKMPSNQIATISYKCRPFKLQLLSTDQDKVKEARQKKNIASQMASIAMFKSRIEIKLDIKIPYLLE